MRTTTEFPLHVQALFIRSNRCGYDPAMCRMALVL
jgi:hypothetical protein